jgi:hypothetical protein
MPGSENAASATTTNDPTNLRMPFMTLSRGTINTLLDTQMTSGRWPLAKKKNIPAIRTPQPVTE